MMKYHKKVSAHNKLMNVIRKITPKTFIAYERDVHLLTISHPCGHKEYFDKDVTQKFHVVIKDRRYFITIKEVS